MVVWFGRSFYAEKGLKVLNAWLQDGLSRKKEPGMSKEKRRVEMFSQVRALLRVRDPFPHSFINTLVHMLSVLMHEFACVWRGRSWT